MKKHPLRSLIVAFFVVLSAIAIPTRAAEQPGQAGHRVVIQVSDNDPGKWNLALNNAQNIQDDLGKKNVRVEIVAYGPGLPMLKWTSVVGSRVGEAIAAGVKVAACETTMRKTHLTKGDMLPNLQYVPSGVTHIMKLQEEGYAYIRP
ncbi:MAG: DsrE family protein [Acidiferrobacterales bacterium]